MAGLERIKDCRFALGMLTVQVIAAGLQLLSRIILNEGAFVIAFVAYRHIVAAVCVVPFALVFERDGGKKLSWLAFFWLFAVALTGISMAMGLFYYGFRDTTATYATNFLNLIPIVTFLLSVILGIEKLHLNTGAGKMKTIGAILCLAGGLTIVFYKGKSFRIGHHSFLVHPSGGIPVNHWGRGTLLLACSCLCYGLWFIFQTKLFKVFPHKFWATFYTSIMATVQLVVIGLCINRSSTAWGLAWNLHLVTIFYSGALSSAATFYIIFWTMAKHGPTYPSMFNPLALILVAAAEALFLGEPLRVGSLIGMALILVGLYLFLLAKNREIKAMAPPKPMDIAVAPSSASNI